MPPIHTLLRLIVFVSCSGALLWLFFQFLPTLQFSEFAVGIGAIYALLWALIAWHQRRTQPTAKPFSVPTDERIQSNGRGGQGGPRRKRR